MDAAHISPVFHAETLAIHQLATQYPEFKDSKKALTLYTTGECEPMGQSALFWANILGFAITRVVYGTSISTISRLWGWGEQMSSREFNKTFSHSMISIDGPLLEEECTALFEQARQHQQKLGLKRPGETLSNKLEDFWDI